MGKARKSASTVSSLKRQLLEEDRREAVKEFTVVARQAEAIPLHTRAQYPLYIEARSLHLIRVMAKMDGVSVQHLLRECLDAMIDKRVYKPQKRGAYRGRRVSKKK